MLVLVLVVEASLDRCAPDEILGCEGDGECRRRAAERGERCQHSPAGFSISAGHN